MKKYNKIFLIVFASLLLNIKTAYAHACYVNELGGTYLQFTFSGGALISGARITVYDADGNQIGVGKTDSQGIYSYEKLIDNASKITMNDGQGHSVSYTVPDEIPPITDKTPTPKEKSLTGGNTKKTPIFIIVTSSFIIIILLIILKLKK